MFDEDLTHLCDACGRPIGGGYKHCPKCNIYFCFICRIKLKEYTNTYPLKCLICNQEFE